LRKQVNRCQLNFSMQWIEEDIEDVTSYVATHYKKLDKVTAPTSN